MLRRARPTATRSLTLIAMSNRSTSNRVKRVTSDAPGAVQTLDCPHTAVHAARMRLSRVLTRSVRNFPLHTCHVRASHAHASAISIQLSTQTPHARVCPRPPASPTFATGRAPVPVTDLTTLHQHPRGGGDGRVTETKRVRADGARRDVLTTPLDRRDKAVTHDSSVRPSCRREHERFARHRRPDST